MGYARTSEHPHSHLPLPTHKKCSPTPTHPKYYSTHSQPPIKNVHPSPPTQNILPLALTHLHSPIKNIHVPPSIQNIRPLCPTHPWTTSIHTKFTSIYPQTPWIYLHPSLLTHKKMSTQPHPTKIYLYKQPPFIKNLHSPPTIQNNLYPPPPLPPCQPQPRIQY